MIGPMIWVLQHIMQHLDDLGLLKLNMLPIAKTFGEILVHQLSIQTPYWRVVHPQHMITFGDELLGHHVYWTIA